MDIDWAIKKLESGSLVSRKCYEPGCYFFMKLRELYMYPAFGVGIKAKLMDFRIDEIKAKDWVIYKGELHHKVKDVVIKTDDLLDLMMKNNNSKIKQFIKMYHLVEYDDRFKKIGE